ncbi:MAG: type II secretion system major pseudopilin GspG [SAR324 cluster bacterium]|nr:type II secretion system major pseudopilin GspG [SAR324 cluster bacterium]
MRQHRLHFYNRLNHARQAGVSFIEIMIVIVIMAAIAALAGPALFNQFSGAKVNQAKIQMQSFLSTLDLYRIDNNTFPTSEHGLKALVEKPTLGKIPERWNGPYISGNKIPLDPWSNAYIYAANGQSYDIRSLGADSKEGGTGNDKDIVCTQRGCN